MSNNKQFADGLNGDNNNLMQVDVRPSLALGHVYTEKLKHEKAVPSGAVAVVIDSILEVSGADELYFITGGAFPATTVTVQFYLGKYEDATAAAAISVPLGTAGEFAKTAITIPDAPFDTHIKVTCSFTGGDYELFLGKKGLS